MADDRVNVGYTIRIEDRTFHVVAKCNGQGQAARKAREMGTVYTSYKGQWVVIEPARKKCS